MIKPGREWGLGTNKSEEIENSRWPVGELQQYRLQGYQAAASQGPEGWTDLLLIQPLWLPAGYQGGEMRSLCGLYSGLSRETQSFKLAGGW